MAGRGTKAHGGAPRRAPRRQDRAADAEGDDDPGGERLLDVQEAARRLGVKPRTLYQWAYQRRLPVVKLFGPRGALRFRLSDVEQLIQDSLRPEAPRPRPEASPPGDGAEHPEPDDEATEP